MLKHGLKDGKTVLWLFHTIKTYSFATKYAQSFKKYIIKKTLFNEIEFINYKKKTELPKQEIFQHHCVQSTLSKYSKHDVAPRTFLSEFHPGYNRRHIADKQYS